ncbi:MAG TPA: hypothetical protein VGF63_13570 [Solirubrobacteraceae bacterium]|jgi:hypothetical protein
MPLRKHTVALALAALAGAAAIPSSAAASPPWSAPASIPAATGAPVQSVFTAAGHGVVLSPNGGGRSAPAQLAAVTPAGAVTSTTPLAFVGDDLATYAGDRIAVAGQTLATAGPDIGTIDDSSSIVTRLGTPAALGAQHTVPGTKGQQIYGLASNHAGLMALMTGAGTKTRTVFIRKPGSSTFSAKLRFSVSSRARGATVAVGDTGDVLVVYEDAHEIRARHIGPHGSVGAVHELGAGVQSDLQAIVDDDGRLEVAWKSQRVDEGEAATPALVWFATAAPGHGFGSAHKIATVGQVGAGRYVAAPAVRLLAVGNDALLAYTGYDGANYRVEAQQIARGHLGGVQQLSPAGVDAVLGDAAVDAQGAQIVAWRSGVAGADPSGLPGGQASHTPVLANVRPAGAVAFGAAELVSPADTDVPLAPSAALDPVSGRAIVAYGLLTPQSAQLASRPAF